MFIDIQTKNKNNNRTSFGSLDGISLESFDFPVRGDSLGLCLDGVAESCDGAIPGNQRSQQ